jgi:hypothetical protein
VFSSFAMVLDMLIVLVLEREWDWVAGRHANIFFPKENAFQVDARRSAIEAGVCIDLCSFHCLSLKLKTANGHQHPQRRTNLDSETVRSSKRNLFRWTLQGIRDYGSQASSSPLCDEQCLQCLRYHLRNLTPSLVNQCIGPKCEQVGSQIE